MMKITPSRSATGGRPGDAPVSPSLAAYREMVRDIRNETFKGDVIGDFDEEKSPNPFDKYDQPDDESENIVYRFDCVDDMD